MVYLNLLNQVPYLLIRTFHLGGFWFSLRGAHELSIRREGNTLQLRRWSYSAQQAKPWASLAFKTWEGGSSLASHSAPISPLFLPLDKTVLTSPELVLFHCCFVSLKARNSLTVRLNPEEQYIAQERPVFEGYVHLSVYVVSHP